LLDFYVDDFGSKDNMTINFTMIFDEPYMVGLLKKRSDNLFFDVKPNFDYNKLFYGNITEIQLTTKSAYGTIPLTFDWNNVVMATFRSIAKNMYWGMIGLISLQFFLLLVR
jgi:hypothetical protein